MKSVQESFFETLKKVLKIVPILTVLGFEFSNLMQKMSLFLLGKFIGGRKYHIIIINHEIKYPEQAVIYICDA